MFDIENIAFSVLGYAISYVELIGTIFGLISVYLATKANIWTWATGIINIVCLFILFYQIQLYADMTLQIYFLFVSIYGWLYWRKEDNKKVSSLTKSSTTVYIIILFLSTVLLGFIFSNVHIMIPGIFTKPASYPYWDSFTTVASILATILLSQKKIQTWVLWILVDVVCVVLYYIKGVYFLSLEYAIFTYLCIFGLINWYKKL
jgi:nicotinamide mononucleotide transporter